MDFCKFIWIQIDINNSKAHRVFMKIIDNYADDDSEAPVDRVEDQALHLSFLKGRIPIVFAILVYFATFLSNSTVSGVAG